MGKKIKGVAKMTKKRFVNKGKDIFQYGEWWCSAGGEHCADVIATAINELIEENDELKKYNELMEKTLDNIGENLANYRNEWVDL